MQLEYDGAPPAKRQRVLPSASTLLDVTHGMLDECAPSAGGRIRSFPHVAGNFASHIYISISLDERSRRGLYHCLRKLRAAMHGVTLEMHDMDSLHISLSRTVAIRSPQISHFVEGIREAVLHSAAFQLSFGDFESYVNDEGTRSFLALSVSLGAKEVISLIKAVDVVFGRFGLQEYYSNPQPHMSVAWAIGRALCQYLPPRENTCDDGGGSPDADDTSGFGLASVSIADNNSCNSWGNETARTHAPPQRRGLVHVHSGGSSSSTSSSTSSSIGSAVNSNGLPGFGGIDVDSPGIDPGHGGFATCLPLDALFYVRQVSCKVGDTIHFFPLVQGA
eukprot:Rmarinus@m.28511